MATKIQIKRSTTGGNTPTLDEGELAVNLVDKRLFTANATTVFDALQNTASSFSVTTNAGEAILVGNSTVNVVANSTTIKLSNSTAAWTISKPTAAEVSAGDYYLGSDGTWQQAGSASVGGTNTQIQYNDSGSFGGSDGFVFDDSTNNVTIANTLTVNVMTVLESFTINTDSLSIGNSTVNAVVNSLALTIANSTVTWSLTKPTAAEVSAGDYYIGSDGTWQQPPDTVPGGSNTYIQYNDSSVFGGSAAFTFNESTNNVTIANTITVGSNFIANGSGSYPASNSVGTALGAATQRWILTANTISTTGTITASANINAQQLNVTLNGAYPNSNTVGTALGDGTRRWVLTANTGDFTGAITSTANVTTSGNINAAAGYFTGAVNASTFTTTGNANAGAGYFGGVVNATTFTTTGNANAGNIYVTANANAAVFKTTGWVGNTIAINPTSNTIALGNTIGRWVITANSIDTQGFSGNATALNPTANTILLGNTIGRWVITANTVTTSGNITSGGNVNGAVGYFTSSVNATTFTTTGNVNGAAGYFTSSVNATTFTTTGNVNAGSTYVTGGTYPVSNSSGQALGSTTRRWVITANTITTSGNITTDGSIVPTSNTQTLGSTTARWVITANSFQTSSNSSVGWSSMTSGNPYLYLYGWDSGASSVKYGRLSVSTDGSFNIAAEDTYLILDAATYVQIQKPLNLTQKAILFSGDAVLDTEDTGATLCIGRDTTFTNIKIGASGGQPTAFLPYLNNSTSLGNSSLSFKEGWFTANVTTSGNVNAAAGYFTGAVNATSFTTTGIIANTIGIYPVANNSGENWGDITNRPVITANSISLSNGVYPQSNTVGTTLGISSGRWVLYANTGNFSGDIDPIGNTQSLGDTTTRWNLTGNSIAISGALTTQTGLYPSSNSSGQELGSSTQRWNFTGNTISISSTITASGNITGSNVNGAIGYFTGLVNAANFTTTGNANASIHYAGANVYANTTSVRVGNSIVNTIVANDTVYIGNTTVNCSINSTAIYFDGVEFSPGATPGGSNTYIQYNSSTALGGSVGFTFDESTNNVIVANNMDIATISTVSQYVFVGNDEINTVVGPGAIILGGKDIVGTQTKYFSKDMIVTRTTNGPATGTAESTTNKQMIETWDFDTSTQEYAQFSMLMPKSWALNGLRFQSIWSSSGASSGNVVWQFQARAYTQGDLIDGIWSDPVYTTTANVELAGSVRISPETPQCVPTNSPSQGCYVMVQVSRATGNSGDTMSGDARLHGVKMMYYTTHTTDD